MSIDKDFIAESMDITNVFNQWIELQNKYKNNSLDEIDNNENELDKFGIVDKNKDKDKDKDKDIHKLKHFNYQNDNIIFETNDTYKYCYYTKINNFKFFISKIKIVNLSTLISKHIYTWNIFNNKKYKLDIEIDKEFLLKNIYRENKHKNGYNYEYIYRNGEIREFNFIDFDYNDIKDDSNIIITLVSDENTILFNIIKDELMYKINNDIIV